MDCRRELEKLNHRFLKFIFKDNSDYKVLTVRAGITTLKVRRIQDICILGTILAPSYLNSLVTLRNNMTNLRGHKSPKLRALRMGLILLIILVQKSGTACRIDYELSPLLIYLKLKLVKMYA